MKLLQMTIVSVSAIILLSAAALPQMIPTPAERVAASRADAQAQQARRAEFRAALERLKKSATTNPDLADLLLILRDVLNRNE